MLSRCFFSKNTKAAMLEAALNEPDIMEVRDTSYRSPFDIGNDPFGGSSHDHRVIREWDSLGTHARTSLRSRVGLPVLILATFCFFASSNAGTGVNIRMELAANNQPILNLPPVFEETLLVNVIDMMKAGSAALSIFILFFSGVWPYAKLIMMVCCWCLPAHKLTIPWRQFLLEFLDAFGKWSLVDSFMLVFFLVSFNTPLSCQNALPELANVCKEADMDGSFRIYVQPTSGFYVYLLATMMSLVAGLWMSYCHRYAQQIGEFGPMQEYEEGKQSLSTLLMPWGTWSILFHKAVPGLCVVSFVLCCFGIDMDAFQFQFLGITRLVLGPEASLRSFSLASLAFAIPESSIDPSNPAINFIEVFFIVFSGCMVLAFLATLTILWMVPMTVKQHRLVLVVAQVLNSVCGLDVFVLTVVASVFQIRPYVQFILKQTKLTTLNPILEKYIPAIPYIAERVDDSYSVYDLQSELKPGFTVLLLSCLISSVVGMAILRKCSKALFDTLHRPLTVSFAEAGSHRSSF